MSLPRGGPTGTGPYSIQPRLLSCLRLTVLGLDAVTRMYRQGSMVSARQSRGDLGFVASERKEIVSNECPTPWATSKICFVGATNGLSPKISHTVPRRNRIRKTWTDRTGHNHAAEYTTTQRDRYGGKRKDRRKGTNSRKDEPPSPSVKGWENLAFNPE